MRKLKRSEKVLAISLSIFIVVYFVENVVMSAFTNKVDLMDVKIKADQRKYERLLYIDANRDLILKTYNKVKPYLETEKSESDSLSVIMKYIEETARDNIIDLLKMRPEASEGNTGTIYKTKKITLTIEGAQKNVMNFLYILENSNYPLSIDKLDLRIKDRKLSIMTAEISLYCMYFI